jgi:hypothetical protein
MSDERDLIELERFHDRLKVIGIGIHVIAGPWLTRAAVASAIVRHHPASIRGQE